MRGPHEPWLLCIVVERLAYFGGGPSEVGLGDEDVRPQFVLQLCFGYGPRPCFDQKREQIERLGRQVNFRSSTQKLARCGIQRQTAESQPHRPARTEANSEYIVAAPPRVATSGSLCDEANSFRNGFSPGR